MRKCASVLGQLAAVQEFDFLEAASKPTFITHPDPCTPLPGHFCVGVAGTWVYCWAQVELLNALLTLGIQNAPAPEGPMIRPISRLQCAAFRAENMSLAGKRNPPFRSELPQKVEEAILGNTFSAGVDFLYTLKDAENAAPVL